MGKKLKLYVIGIAALIIMSITIAIYIVCNGSGNDAETVMDKVVWDTPEAFRERINTSEGITLGIQDDTLYIVEDSGEVTTGEHGDLQCVAKYPFRCNRVGKNTITLNFLGKDYDVDVSNVQMENTSEGSDYLLLLVNYTIHNDNSIDVVSLECGGEYGDLALTMNIDRINKIISE